MKVLLIPLNNETLVSLLIESLKSNHQFIMDYPRAVVLTRGFMLKKFPEQSTDKDDPLFQDFAKILPDERDVIIVIPTKKGLVVRGMIKETAPGTITKEYKVPETEPVDVITPTGDLITLGTLGTLLQNIAKQETTV